MNGRSGNLSDQAYTLARLRKEERLMDTTGIPYTVTEDKDDIDESGAQNTGNRNTEEVVDEMYDNMNTFDKKIKMIARNTARLTSVWTTIITDVIQ